MRHAAAAGRDVVLLNSDTLVAPGWVEELRAAAYGARRYRHGHAALERCDDPELSEPTRRNAVPDLRRRRVLPRWRDG